MLLEMSHLSKVYPGNKVVVDDFNLDVEKGEFICFIGTSGSGKTTTMRMINRMLKQSSGTIKINGQDIAKMDPVKLRRKIGYVIQNIGLMPHMTIRENITLVPKLLKWSEEKRNERAKEMIKLVDLPEDFLDRYPSQLSGGQQQR
ncbi:ATP-binding cassette domain-containing protein, partial [Pediococcus pentosaceus]